MTQTEIVLEASLTCVSCFLLYRLIIIIKIIIIFFFFFLFFSFFFFFLLLLSCSCCSGEVFLHAVSPFPPVVFLCRFVPITVFYIKGNNTIQKGTKRKRISELLLLLAVSFEF